MSEIRMKMVDQKSVHRDDVQEYQLIRRPERDPDGLYMKDAERSGFVCLTGDAPVMEAGEIVTIVELEVEESDFQVREFTGAVAKEIREAYDAGRKEGFADGMTRHMQIGRPQAEEVLEEAAGTAILIYDPEAVCRKCGSSNAKTTHFSPKYARYREERYFPKERMKRECVRCGWVWYECPLDWKFGQDSL